MLNIYLILGSTRQGRQGEKVANWTHKYLKSIAPKDINIELVDLRDWPLPFYEKAEEPVSSTEEPESDEIDIRWRKKIAKADGFIIITPEYNHGYPAVLKNALDHAFADWNHKPVAFISYSSGQIAGARSVEQLRQIGSTLMLVVLREAVHIPVISKAFDEKGEPTDEKLSARIDKLFSIFVLYANQLKELRGKLS